MFHTFGIHSFDSYVTFFIGKQIHKKYVYLPFVFSMRNEKKNIRIHPIRSINEKNQYMLIIVERYTKSFRKFSKTIFCCFQNVKKKVFNFIS